MYSCIGYSDTNMHMCMCMCMYNMHMHMYMCCARVHVHTGIAQWSDWSQEWSSLGEFAMS